MKKTALVLSVLLATAGAAAAGDAAAINVPDGSSVRQEPLDTRAERSEDSFRHTAAHGAAHDSQQIGIDVNPWFMPIFH